MNQKLNQDKGEKCTTIIIPKQVMWYRTIIMLLAIYASFRHKEEFNLKHFLLAVFFPEIYLIYMGAVNRKALLS